MKRFIAILPFSAQLRDVRYESVDNDALSLDMYVKFPILPVIYAYAPRDSEPWAVDLIVTKGEDGARTGFLADFRQELEALCARERLRYPPVEPLYVPNDESVRCEMRNLAALLTRMGEDELIYADITAGTKTLSNTLSMALRGVPSLRRSSSVECVVYGQFDRMTGENKIYDITALYRMERIVDLLGRSGDPDRALAALLEGLEAADGS